MKRTYTIIFYNDKKVVGKVAVFDETDETRIRAYAEKKREEIAWNYGLFTDYKLEKAGKNK